MPDNEPLVSILVPVYNMERYLGRCLKALVGQTLEDIEIVAIDDGSTDSSPDILRSFAAADDRVRVIEKPNSGYGASMNRGLDVARGRYVGIVEPDDYPDAVMFQKLFEAAEKNGCDLVKCNYYEHFDDHESIKRAYGGFRYNVPFDPADMPHVICTVPSIWAGLYRRSMITANGMRFRETPGASFQDTSFTLKAWFAARRAVLLRRPLLHYRMDNPASSVKSADKVHVVCDELAEAERFVRADPVRCGAFVPWLQADRWHKYQWNYSRIDPAFHLEFAERMYDEYRQAAAAGEIVSSLFGDNSIAQLALLLADGPEAFARRYPGDLPYDDQADPCAADAAPLVARLFGEVPQGPSPAVTVMVAAFNCERYLGECLESLKRQTYADFEVVVVDDGSSDGTAACARACAEGDSRFTVIESKDNQGPGAARNHALDVACGQYVMYVDADDRLAADALAKLVGKARRQDLDELYFSAQSFYEDDAALAVMNEDFADRVSYDGVASGRDLFTFMSDRGQYYAQGALRMVKRSLVEGEGVRFPEGMIHEDVLYGFRVMVASARSSFLNEPVYLRRQRSGSIMGASRRSVDNVYGHVVSVLEIRRWIRDHAADLDPAFLKAVGREAGTWSYVAARDWNDALTDEERASLAAGLCSRDRTALFFDILGCGEASARAADEWRESDTYRLGDAIATVPRLARRHMSAWSSRRKADGLR